MIFLNQLSYVVFRPLSVASVFFAPLMRLSGQGFDAVFVMYVFPGITYAWMFSIIWFNLR